MGCDIHAVLEIETYRPGEFDSLSAVESYPRNYQLFAALAGVRGEGDAKPLYAPRGLPPGMSPVGFRECYREIVDHRDVLDWRGIDFVLPYEVGKATILPYKSARCSLSKLGYVLFEGVERPSWLFLSELREALRHAGIEVETLDPEYRYMLATMALAEATFGKRARIVFWFDSI